MHLILSIGINSYYLH